MVPQGILQLITWTMYAIMMMRKIAMAMVCATIHKCLLRFFGHVAHTSEGKDHFLTLSTTRQCKF